MKRKVILLALIVGLAIAGVSTLVIRQLTVANQRARAAAAAFEAETAARIIQEERLKEAERERGRVERQNVELASLATQLRQSEASQASNIAALAKQKVASVTESGNGAEGPPGGGKGMGDMFQKMMKDPAMKEMLRNQQKGLMKTMYGPLFKDINLPADQQAKLSDLLLDTQMSAMDSAADLFGADAANKTNALNVVSERQKATEDQIKGLLGDEKYAQYEDYKKTMGDRVALNQFQQQAAGTENALSDDQYKQLVQLMKDERSKNPPVIGSDSSNTAEGLSKLMNEELLNQQFQWQEDFNQRVLERAASLLSPEQVKEWTDFQTQQLNMQKVGIKMAREMFKQ